MRACVQRVSQAQVTVDNEVVGKIGRGLLVLIGVAADDDPSEAEQLAAKILHLRIFDDAEGKMNLSLLDLRGELLAVSQFTLLADCRKGRRPSFVAAAPGPKAEDLYERIVQCFRSAGISVATGRFAAHMEVSLTNDGPVTILLDTRQHAVG